jgi:hypothetical protein
MPSVESQTTLPKDGPIYFYPTSFNYNGSKLDDVYPIELTYFRNVLSGTDWVDCMTLTEDNKAMIEMIRWARYKIPSIDLKEDKVYSYIFINKGILPTPDIVVYKCSNRPVGKEYIYKQFSKSVTITQEHIHGSRDIVNGLYRSRDEREESDSEDD